MYINEVFKSCQGEGVHAGLPTVFVRLQGCNLAIESTPCIWCDTSYAQTDKGKRMNPSKVVEEVERLSNGCRCVCITGGEPLYQASELLDLVDILKFREYFVEVFTNSTLKPPTFFFVVDSWVVDLKCPSSGISDKCLVPQWLGLVRKGDALKFVVSDQQDLEYVLACLRYCETSSPILISPMVPNSPNSQFGEVLMSQRKWLQTVWEFCVEHDYRFSFQTHKLVFGNKRGI